MTLYRRLCDREAARLAGAMSKREGPLTMAEIEAAELVLQRQGVKPTGRKVANYLGVSAARVSQVRNAAGAA